MKKILLIVLLSLPLNAFSQLKIPDNESFEWGDCFDYIKICKNLAESGNPQAQLGMAQINADGVNNKKYIFWSKKAALNGVAVAQKNLGYAYLQGEDVLPDKVEAFKWFEMAAKNGKISSQEYIASAYEKGHGIPANFALSYYWSLIAQGNSKTENYKMEQLQIRLRKTLSSSDVLEIQRKVNINFHKYKSDDY